MFGLICLLTTALTAGLDRSLQLEAEHALKKGALWFIKQQTQNGSCRDQNHPVLTAMSDLP